VGLQELTQTRDIDPAVEHVDPTIIIRLPGEIHAQPSGVHR